MTRLSFSLKFVAGLGENRRVVNQPSKRRMVLSIPPGGDVGLEEANVAVMRVKNGRSAKSLLLLSRHLAARIHRLDRICEVLSAGDVHVVRVRSSKDRSLPAALGGQLYDAVRRGAGNDFEPDSGVLEFDLTSLLEAIGASASQAGTAYAILIDDMHSLEGEQLSALIGALHWSARRGLPIVLIGAGTSKLRREIGFAKPYAERMFDFIDLDGR